MLTKHPRPRIAIVGGGLAGLECALAAVKKGADVEIVEPGNQTRTRHVNWDLARYPGDEKTRPWTSEGWGKGGGLSERLGGRSLCYHGVFLELDPPAGACWGPLWQRRLAGKGGLYESITDEMREVYPELVPRTRSILPHPLGIRHVPQAARLDPQSRFEAYSPLFGLKNYIDQGRVTITRARATAAVPAGGRTWKIEVKDGNAICTLAAKFDRCVMAASAIGNVQLLSGSLKRDITTNITDHFCVGAFMRVRQGTSLNVFRHLLLWSGYVPLPHLTSNLFFLERPPLPDGDRLIELMAVTEQAGSGRDHSTLSVNYHDAHFVRTHIHGNISISDLERLRAVRKEVAAWADKIADVELQAVRPALGKDWICGGKHDGEDIRWNSYDVALRTVTESEAANVYCEYELPYGAFEHEACSHPIGHANNVPISNDLEVMELPGVYAVGPGVFPRLGAANPALTIVATSRWAGEFLAQGAA